VARLAFFGTPDFAVRSAVHLLAFCKAQGHELCLVVCQPDRRSGRGKKMQPPPVKVWAMEHGLEVRQPPTLKKGVPEGDAFREELAQLNLDVAVVAAYGRILPRGVLRMAKRGFVNVHGSLLPRWRGAAPIERAIEAGDAETGICIMDMVFELDAGDVYASRALPIGDADDATGLREALAELGGALLAETLPSILDGTATPTPQPEVGVTYAHMLKKEEAVLDWSQDARKLFDQVRAFVPWPGSQSTLKGGVVKFFAPSLKVPATVSVKGEVGTVLAIDDQIWIRCRDGAIGFSEAQLPGKKRMPVKNLKHGRAVDVGDRLGQ
jgi:methionyl-tRNA formyltransferase